MPYTKEVGKTPVYQYGEARTLMDIKLSRYLKLVKVPHRVEPPFIVYEDSFDAFVRGARHWGSFRRWLES